MPGSFSSRVSDFWCMMRREAPLAMRYSRLFSGATHGRKILLFSGMSQLRGRKKVG